MISRRGIIGGLLGLVASPAIVHAASIMPVKAAPLYVPPKNTLLTLNMITRESIIREAIRLWKNSNAFMQNIDMQYENAFAM